MFGGGCEDLHEDDFDEADGFVPFLLCVSFNGGSRCDSLVAALEENGLSRCECHRQKRHLAESE